MEKISVIIPVYKVEKVLDECITSVVGQTYSELEIILVDDGSPDGCPEKCDEWANRDSRIRVIHQENKGLSGARNSGLEIMTGEYVTFVDSDDAVHPEMLERLLSALKEGADMSVCTFMRFSDGQLPSPVSEPMGRVEMDSADRILRHGTMLKRPEAWGKLYKREVFDGLRFKNGILYEDTQLLPYVLMRCERIAAIPDCLYFYRKNESGIMSSGISERKFCVFDVYAEQIRLYKRLGMPIAGSVVSQALVARTVKASVICHGSLRRRFYGVFFKNLPTVLFLPPKYLSVKDRVLYLSTAIPIKPFRSYYERKLSGSVDFGDTSNF